MNHNITISLPEEQIQKIKAIKEETGQEMSDQINVALGAPTTGIKKFNMFKCANYIKEKDPYVKELGIIIYKLNKAGWSCTIREAKLILDLLNDPEIFKELGQ